MKRICCRIIFLSSLAVFLNAGMINAQMIRALSSEVFSITIQNQVESISQNGDFIVVGEQKIYLIDSTYGNTKCTTSIQDVHGLNIPFSRVSVGKQILIRGIEIPSKGVIGAGAIYILPRKLSEKEMRRYPALTTLQKWETLLIGE